MFAIRSFLFAFTLLSLASVSLFADDDSPKPAGGAPQQLQGQWKIEWLESDGQRRRPEAEQARTPLVVAENQIQVGEIKVLFSIDAGADPKLIDVTLAKGTDNERTFEGIYKLEADTWTVCLFLDDSAKQRPVSFETKPDSKLAVFIFSRIK
jgi:uncharacterized protein (TIGR03067 family)